MKADLILFNGKIHSFNPETPNITAVAIKNGKFIGVGNDSDIMQFASEETKIIDLQNKRAVPGINDSHIHLIRGGLNYNLELRWDGVPSLADALRMLKEQVNRTPNPQWVRVVGGWSEFQFAERRMPTLEEINAIAPDTPVFILHLYDRAIMNRAALRAVGYNKNTPAPPGGHIERDSNGEPTGLIIATPNAMILYSTLAKGPTLSYEHQLNSTRHFMKELNRFGITSVIDAGGGFQNFPDDYKVVNELNEKNQLTVRIAYNLFTQKPKHEFEDFSDWIDTVKLYQGNDMYRHNGAGEMLVFSAADFEDFLQPRPDLPENMEAELEKVVRLLVENRWPFRLHATYNESITRFLNVFEKINQDIPFNGLPWIFDHAETIDERNIERVKALGGGIAVQSRMAYQGEYFTDRYGAKAAENTPPIKKMIEMEVPVGAGSDATRVSSYNPWVSMYWMTVGKTVGGLQLYNETRLNRQTALELYTRGSAWFSQEQTKKGDIKVGMFADLVVLDRDYFAIDDEDIKKIEADLTIVDGKIVYANGDFSSFSPPHIPILPDWSPTNIYNGYPVRSGLQSAIGKNAKADAKPKLTSQIHSCSGSCDVHLHNHDAARLSNVPVNNYNAFWGALGCSCFAF
ncbi:N-substituted formamide deformylase precursor [Flavobacterium anhuiense]|uniref:N-substituted formamide deformylase n=1 Tax=Flavobacterium anhuiense TaxID=459526 RepID=A0AAC9GLE0_9FLAO|nr:amidohydrolase [Flavobacterium anhuiense]AOC97131.1 N-substituted formamide deformylase precursor [Flavobacterium anhuiense]